MVAYTGILTISKSFHFQFLSKGKKRVQILLSQEDLPLVHEGKQGFHVCDLDAFQIHQGVAVLDVLQDFPEEVGTGRHHHLVHLNLLMFSTDEGQIREIFVLLQVVECVADVVRELSPAEAKLLTRRHCQS